MIDKSLHVLTFASVVVIGVIAASVVFATADSGEAISEKQSKVPRYSDTCAHGHNGFDCKSPKYRTDIADLQERVNILEKRVSKP